MSVIKNKEYFEFLQNCFTQNQNGKSWATLTRDYYNKYGERVTRSCLRHRAQGLAKKLGLKETKFDVQKLKEDGINQTYTTYNADGSVEASKVIDCSEKEIQDPIKLLKILGYDSSKWELVTYRVSIWEGGKNNAKKHAIQYKIKPKTELSTNDLLSAVKEAFKCNITPLNIKYTKKDGLDNNKLMEIAPIELHMGKLAHEIETGENYDLKIAQKRFYDIFEKIVEKQEVEKCGKCVLIIGSDFFNSESDNCTSVNKIPQQNDSRYIKLFTEGIKMYSKVIITLSEIFNSVDVMLCAGNHAHAMETFLYIALAQRFYNTCVKFIENYKQTQSYLFGKCAIFYNHGDANLKQTIKSIPAEFYEIWGSHPYRELHLGHLHKEVTVDDEGGMITRRIGSPCSTDAWHYSNRFVGAVKKHQIFIWHKDSGLNNIYYIPVV